MARILISPQRHSDNFTTKQGGRVGRGGQGEGALFSSPIKRATVPSLSRGASAWHQAAETSNSVSQHPPDPSESGLLEGELQLFGCDSEILFVRFSATCFTIALPGSATRKFYFSQDPRQVIVFPQTAFYSPMAMGHSSPRGPSPTSVRKGAALALSTGVLTARVSITERPPPFPSVHFHLWL